MSIPLSTISDTLLTMTWRQQRATESLNRKLSVVPRGVIRGFCPRPGIPDLSVAFEVDALTGESVMNARTSNPSDPYSVTYRETGTVTVGGVGDFAVSTTYWIGVIVEYSIGVATAARWEAYDAADMIAGAPATDGAILLCRVETPAVAGPILSENIVLGDEYFLFEGAGSSAGTSESGMIQYAAYDLGMRNTPLPVLFTDFDAVGAVVPDTAVKYSGVGSLRLTPDSLGSQSRMLVTTGMIAADIGDSFVLEVVYRTPTGVDVSGSDFSIQAVNYSGPSSSSVYTPVDTGGAFVVARVSFSPVQPCEVLAVIDLQVDQVSYVDSIVIWRNAPNRVVGQSGRSSDLSPKTAFGFPSLNAGWSMVGNLSGSATIEHSGVTGSARTMFFGQNTLVDVEINGSLVARRGEFSEPFGSSVGGGVYFEDVLGAGVRLTLVDGASSPIGMELYAATLWSETVNFDAGGGDAVQVFPTSPNEIVFRDTVTADTINVQAFSFEATDYVQADRIASTGVTVDDGLNISPVRALNTVAAYGVFTFTAGAWVVTSQYGIDTTFGAGGVATGLVGTGYNPEFRLDGAYSFADGVVITGSLVSLTAPTSLYSIASEPVANVIELRPRIIEAAGVRTALNGDVLHFMVMAKRIP